MYQSNSIRYSAVVEYRSHFCILAKIRVAYATFVAYSVLLPQHPCSHMRSTHTFPEYSIRVRITLQAKKNVPPIHNNLRWFEHLYYVQSYPRLSPILSETLCWVYYWTQFVHISVGPPRRLFHSHTDVVFLAEIINFHSLESHVFGIHFRFDDFWHEQNGALTVICWPSHRNAITIKAPHWNWTACNVVDVAAIDNHKTHTQAINERVIEASHGYTERSFGSWSINSGEYILWAKR